MKISGTGCSLMDLLYARVDFSGPGFTKYLSRRSGDGGLNPGHLVFLEELEKFSGVDSQVMLADITEGKSPDKSNLGGPAVVALVNTAQLLERRGTRVEFYGAAGDDEHGDGIFSIIDKTPLDTANYIRIPGERSPSTYVLSDPDYHGGAGERTFINEIAAAWKYTPENLGDSFFESDILVFGGTALVPGIHDNLGSLLKKGRSSGVLNVVITVFDFRNEARNPASRWPLGDGLESFKDMDLLILDHVEALRISGETEISKAVEFYIRNGTSSFIITNGADPLLAYSDGSVFRKRDITEFPVSKAVVDDLAMHPDKKGDTTGCGDNFCGGVIASLSSQYERKGRGQMDIAEACAWGIASGGFACYYVGGTYLESERGEKLSAVSDIYDKYRHQIKDLCRIAPSPEI